MKKYEIYFFGSDYSFVSAFFLYSLILFTKRNKKFKIKHIVNTDTFFNFDQDIYGKNIEVFFEGKIRDEKKFNGIKELLNQITLDITIAKDKFNYGN